MNRKLAQHIVRVAFRSSAELGNLIPLLKEHCKPDEYEKLCRPIASASATISLNILNLVFTDFPDLELELDEEIKVYGKML